MTEGKDLEKRIPPTYEELSKLCLYLYDKISELKSTIGSLNETIDRYNRAERARMSIINDEPYSDECFED